MSYVNPATAVSCGRCVRQWYPTYFRDTAVRAVRAIHKCHGGYVSRDLLGYERCDADNACVIRLLRAFGIPRCVWLEQNAFVRVLRASGYCDVVRAMRALDVGIPRYVQCLRAANVAQGLLAASYVHPCTAERALAVSYMHSGLVGLCGAFNPQTSRSVC